jgi:hypothetical protein
VTKIYIANLKNDIGAYEAWQIAYKKRTGSLPEVGRDEQGDYVEVPDGANAASIGERPGGKSCGDCSLCCKLMSVEELNKPRNVWCQHLVRGKGCGIYETRPDVCREFYCRWMDDPALGPEWKPNKSKMVLAHHGEDRLTVYVDPGATGAWCQEPYLSRLVAMARVGLEKNGILKIVENGQTLVILPPRVVDLGVVGPDDGIMLEKKPVPGGFTYNVSVVRGEPRSQSDL